MTQGVLNILVVDDEPLARVRMRQLLNDCTDQVRTHVVCEADSGPAAIAAVDEHRPDIVLLDIHMPGMDGIEVARHIARRDRAPAVIFITAFEEHAVQAFELQALDYLVKPVRADRLAQALLRSTRLYKQESRLNDMARSVGAARTHITVSERGRMILIPVDDVLYLRAELKYVTIRTREREYLTEESLSSFEFEFGQKFLRIHRNALVARSKIEGFQRVKSERCVYGEGDAHWEVIVKDAPDRLQISRRQWALVRTAACKVTQSKTTTLVDAVQNQNPSSG